MADDAATPDGEVSESTATEPEPSGTEVSDAVVTDDVPDEGESSEDSDDVADGETPPAKPRMSHVRLATIAGLVLVVALAGLTGWLGFRTYQSHQTNEQEKLFLSVGRQGALNLTTIDWQHADADVQRILDSATGTFYDDFQKRAQPFVEVVKQAQSKSEGTIAEAGIEPDTITNDGAQVLVAVAVKTSNAGAPDQAPRAWRMRITVQKIGDEAKVSNVEFVP
ncbi:MAG TPA: Mce protein [Mycobacterium sp.]|jgi:Mce-associated membrane protein|nr:Mce protein [Mycobacterium sp.]